MFDRVLSPVPSVSPSPSFLPSRRPSLSPTPTTTTLAPTTTKYPGVIAGKVIDAISKKPLIGVSAELSLRDESGDVVERTKSDATTGAYKFEVNFGEGGQRDEVDITAPDLHTVIGPVRNIVKLTSEEPINFCVNFVVKVRQGHCDFSHAMEIFKASSTSSYWLFYMITTTSDFVPGCIATLGNRFGSLFVDRSKQEDLSIGPGQGVYSQRVSGFVKKFWAYYTMPVTCKCGEKSITKEIKVDVKFTKNKAPKPDLWDHNAADVGLMELGEKTVLVWTETIEFP